MRVGVTTRRLDGHWRATVVGIIYPPGIVDPTELVIAAKGGIVARGAINFISWHGESPFLRDLGPGR